MFVSTVIYRTSSFQITLNKLQFTFKFSITVYWKCSVNNNIFICKFLHFSSTILLIFCLQICCLGTYCDILFLTVTVLQSGNASYIGRTHCPHLVSYNVRPTSFGMGENVISDSVPFDFLVCLLSYHHVNRQLTIFTSDIWKECLTHQFIIFKFA
jgi:hypothetical protein